MVELALNNNHSLFCVITLLFIIRNNWIFIHITIGLLGIYSISNTIESCPAVVINVLFYTLELRKLAIGNRRGRDHMVVGFTTTYASSAYHH
jgi:hypothetical protein